MRRFHAADPDTPDAWNGRLLIYEQPRHGHRYVLGVDVAEGVGKDRSVIEVIRYGTLLEPDEQVAEWASDFHTTRELLDVVETLGWFYQGSDDLPALVVIEVTGPGMDVCSDLAGKGYPNLYERQIWDKLDETFANKIGWSTNRATRPRLISKGIHAFSQKDLVVNSPHLFDEMQDFTGDPLKAKTQAKSGRHDDRVMALLIGYHGGHDEEWLAGEDVAAERRARATRLKPTLTAAGQVVKKDWQNTAITYDQMRAEWSD